MAPFQIQAVSVNGPTTGRGTDLKMKMLHRRSCTQHSKNPGWTVIDQPPSVAVWQGSSLFHNESVSCTFWLTYIMQTYLLWMQSPASHNKEVICTYMCILHVMFVVVMFVWHEQKRAVLSVGGGRRAHVSTKNNIPIQVSQILPTTCPFYGVNTSAGAVLETFWVIHVQ